ncbi:MAG: tetratricopeptide repeat protein [Nitrospirae bacterium]|nr:tetratricopeptide repeat protein [Nitrospirota bacterium]
MASLKTTCPGCFQEKGEVAICPRCGFDEGEDQGTLTLPPKTILNGKKYIIGRVLGNPGGFGITYLGWDLPLQTKVAIKEFIPRQLVGRGKDRKTIEPHSKETYADFKYGLEQFLREAQTIAKFDNAHIVRVRSFFEENATAYIVMDYYDGISLTEYLNKQPGAKIPWETAVNIMMPILDGLREVHNNNIIHRDIKPQNIYITASGRPILLDFGAARFSLGDKSQTLTVMMTPGYAPPEQYHKKGKQGPWTDIYASAATLYGMITGEIPTNAAERLSRIPLKPPIKIIPSIPKSLNEAILVAMSMEANARPKTIKDFQAALTRVCEENPPHQEPPQHAPNINNAETVVAGKPQPQLQTNHAKQTCRNCSAAVAAGADFCTMCGAPVSAPASVVKPAPPAKPEHRLTPGELRKRKRLILITITAVILIIATVVGITINAIENEKKAKIEEQRQIEVQKAAAAKQKQEDEARKKEETKKQSGIYFNQGKVFASQKDYARAIEAYTKSIGYAPDAASFNNRGLAYLELKQYDNAVADFTEAIQASPKQYLYYMNRGIANSDRKHYTDAIADYRKAIGLNPSNVDHAYRVYANLAYAHYFNKDYKMAIDECTDAIKKNPNKDEAYVMRGLSYQQLDNCELAIADFTRAIEISPNEGLIYRFRGLNYYDKKCPLLNTKKGNADLSNAVRLGDEVAKEIILKLSSEGRL